MMVGAPAWTIRLLAVAVFLWAALGVPCAQAQTVLRLGYSGAGVGTDLLKVIERSALWRKHGLDVKPIYLTSGTLMAQTLSSGEIGLAGFDVTAMLNLGVSGVTNLKVVSVVINRLEPFFVVHNSVKTPADLKGKRLAISRYGSGSDIITRVVMRYWKLDPDKEVSILQSGNTPARIAALVAGHVDGALVSSVQVPKVLASGCCRVLADLSELPLDYANYGVVVASSMLKNQREPVYRFLQAMTEGIHVFKTQPERALAVLSEGGADPQTTRSLYERLAKAMRDYPAPDSRSIQTVLDSLPSPKARGARADSYTDSSLMEEIKKSGFIDRLYGKSQ